MIVFQEAEFRKLKYLLIELIKAIFQNTEGTESKRIGSCKQPLTRLDTVKRRVPELPDLCALCTCILILYNLHSCWDSIPQYPDALRWRETCRTAPFLNSFCVPKSLRDLCKKDNLIKKVLSQSVTVLCDHIRIFGSGKLATLLGKFKVFEFCNNRIKIFVFESQLLLLFKVTTFSS